MCPIGYSDVINMKRFGTVTQLTCDYDMSILTGKDKNKLPDQTKLPKGANVFYELYI